MILLKPTLPPLWYPQSKEGIADFFRTIRDDQAMPYGQAGNSGVFPQPMAAADAPKAVSSPPAGIAAVAPHAGWYYSGAIAARAVGSLRQDADTIAVIGGHLPAGYPPLMAEADCVQTPLGIIAIDAEFQELLRSRLQAKPDRESDNTVEVLLPMVHYFFPHAKILHLRLPNGAVSFEIGKLLSELGEQLERNLAVLGSSDLTHYGSAYRFTPQGVGAAALEWVKTVNDWQLIQAVIAGDPALLLRRAQEDRSACSVGAILGCLGFAQSRNCSPARLLAYGTSADISGETDQAVGYGAFAWVKAGQ